MVPSIDVLVNETFMSICQQTCCNVSQVDTLERSN